MEETVNNTVSNADLENGNEVGGNNGCGKEKENGTELVDSNNENKGEFGKFKDSKQLLSAYNALLSEFTKRCQKLKELKARVNNFESKGDTVDAGSGFLEALKDDEFIDRVVLDDVRVYKRAIAKYLMEMNLNASSPSLQRGGYSALTPVKKPKSLDEAKKLADLMLAK